MSAVPTGAALPGGGYRALRVPDLNSFLARCAAMETPTTLPFISSWWLRAWYETLGRIEGREPLLVAVQRLDAQGQAHDASLLPLVRVRRHGCVVVEFADAGVCDYVAPLQTPDWAGEAPLPAAAQAWWQAVRGLLAGPDVRADLLLLDKLLPRHLEEAAPGSEHTPPVADPLLAERALSNPLALVLPSRASEMSGNQFTVTGTWEERRRSLDKSVRMEIERCWRVFQRSPTARFERVCEPAAVQRVFSALEELQSARMSAQGSDYRLDEEAYRQFYRRLLAEGRAAEDGPVVLSALFDGEAIVATTLGVANRRRLISLRTALGGAQWKAASPGRLVDDGISQHLHARGWRHFDLGIGEYAHKAKLRMQPIPLLHSCVALSWRGVPAQWWWARRPAVKARLARHPGLLAWVRRLRGQGASAAAPGAAATPAGPAAT